jgi:hypothetical protein
MGSEVVSIFVGRKRKEFNVHKKLICDASKFFRDAFTGAFKEGQEGTMYMPEDDPDVFACFVDWLYRNPLPVVEDTVDSPKKAVELMKASEYKEYGPLTKEEHVQEVARAKKEGEDKKKERDARLSDQFGRLLKLYFFAEKIFLDELMNRAMDRLRRGLAKYDRSLGHREVKIIYMNTIEGSKLRSFCTELLVYNLGTTPDKKLTHLVTLMQELPEMTKDFLIQCKSLSEFKNEFSCEWSDPGSNPDPRLRGEDDEGDGCCFHKHEGSDKEHCYASESDGFTRYCPACGYGPHGYDCGCDWL